MSGAPPPARREQFKSTVGDIASQRRRKQAVIIGKERRDAVVRAKRMRRADDISDEGMMDNEETSMSKQEVSEEALNNDTVHAVEDLKSVFSIGTKVPSQKKIEALRKLRRLLSFSARPPVNAAVQAGVVPVLVKCLDFGSSDEQLVEAAWCLTNIASGDSEHTLAIMPALPLLIAHSGGEGEQTRDTLIAQGALVPLGRLLISSRSSLAKTAAWALSNLIKGPNPKAAMELLDLDGLPQAVTEHMAKGDADLAVEVAWVVVYLTSLTDTKSKTLIKSGLLPPLISRLSASEKLSLLTPVLRSIGNFVAGDNSNTEAVFKAASGIPGGILESLAHCLQSEHRTLQKEAAWVVSNIVAGSLQHKQLVFCSALLPALLHLLATSTFDVRKEAAYALGNLCVMPAGESKVPHPIMEHLTILLERGCLPGFINLVKSPDVEASRLGLQFLELVMRALPNGQGPKLVEKEDGLAALEVLEFHENEELKTMTNELLDKYYGEDYDLEEEYGPGITEVVGVEDYPPWRKGWVVNS